MSKTIAEPALRHSAWTHPAARAFVILGTIATVGGGLLSAATAAMPSYHASWAVAYIVLVPGVAQLVLGVAQTALTQATVRRGIVAGEVLCWNLGNAAVLAGVLTGTPVVLYIGNALMLATLIIMAAVVRHARRGPVLTVTWIVIALLIISIPAGIIIQATTG